MKMKDIILTALALTLPLAGAKAITFTANTTIAAGDLAYDGQPVVVSNCTLTVNGPHSYASLSVVSNGIVTHSPAPSGETSNRLNLTIAGDVAVDATSAVRTDGAGYGSGSGPGAGIYGPWLFWSAGSGGGHGGNGGSVGNVAGGSAYGSLLAPVTAGSGGGEGGAGGGVIRLQVAGTLRVDGQVTANGLNGVTGVPSGGGAGGSLWLTVGELTGGGMISANGGQGNGDPGGRGPAAGGSGGRIAIEYGTNTLTVTITATGQSGYQRGGAGTIYLKSFGQPVGEVRVDNGGAGGAHTPLSAPTLFDLTIANSGYVSPTAALQIGNLTVASNGVLVPVAGQSWLDVTVLGNATVEAAGAINADGRGYGSDSGPGAGRYGEWIWWYAASGAGHGGVGGTVGDVAGGSAYGSPLAPVTAGSGGGSGNSSGGSGGGVIRLQVNGWLQVDGQITAHGLDGATSSGGGAGGSVWLTAGELSGSGSVGAGGGQGIGGSDGRSPAAGGGGGHIAIYGLNFAGSITNRLSVAGGAGYQAGQQGTIYLATNRLPLEVSSFSPTGLLRQAVSSVDMAFNQPVRSETFTPEDVLITVPSGETPHGDITVTPLSASSYRIGFGSQAAFGTYLVQVGPHIENLYGQEMAAAYIGNFAITNPVIAGLVNRTNGIPLANVLLAASGGLGTNTGTNGAYALSVSPGWNGTVTPTLPGWVFTPASLSYVSLTADATNQNFTANLAEAIVLTTTRSGGTLNFRWPSAVGLSYQLQSATNLPAATWFNEGSPFPGTGGMLATNLPPGPEPRKFFRLQANN